MAYIPLSLPDNDRQPRHPPQIPAPPDPTHPVQSLLGEGTLVTHAYYFAQTVSLRKAPFLFEMDWAGGIYKFLKCMRTIQTVNDVSSL
jgi:hypothetical protein